MRLALVILNVASILLFQTVGTAFGQDKLLPSWHPRRFINLGRSHSRAEVDPPFPETSDDLDKLNQRNSGALKHAGLSAVNKLFSAPAQTHDDPRDRLAASIYSPAPVSTNNPKMSARQGDLPLPKSQLQTRSALVNVAKNATLSSTFGASGDGEEGFPAQNAVDGRMVGYWGNAQAVAMTEIEDSPWLVIDLGETFQVSAVELWSPTRRCDSLKYDAQDCREMGVSKQHPLVMTLFEDDPQSPFAQHTFTDTRPVYLWHDVQASARRVHVQLMGEGQQLVTTELRVFVRDDAGHLCSKDSCVMGTCACSGPHCSTKVDACLVSAPSGAPLAQICPPLGSASAAGGLSASRRRCRCRRPLR
ncbi:hypothetical protein CYMTET_30135 [Cymbomonas tetramitiformis]|uniref:F5/8 type C domain-containing protein n=1 Tax=Cymbomonas tetramitiformis TaxID=36881 RepID=A0AAE0FJJ8_9CHLO|nr:hypothetical protein CYMTET_30135 [Cymbomonas tetramitiformis]